MARLLIVTNGPAGTRYSCVALARRLVGAGHDVTLVGSASLGSLAAHHGLPSAVLPASHGPEWRNTDGQRGYLERWRERQSRRLAAWEATGVSAWRDCLAQHAPDLVLMDMEMQEHVLATAMANAPLALLNPFCSIWRSPSSPPPHTKLRPGVGWMGSKPAIWLAWRAFLLRKRARFLRLKLRDAGADRISVLGSVAGEAGFDLRALTDTSQWLIPFTWPAFPALSLHAREFEFTAHTPEGVHFIGPQVLEDRGTDNLAPEDRRRLDALLARFRGPDGEGQSLIFAGFGSFFTARRDWVMALIAAVESRPRWTLVLSLGGQAWPELRQALEQSKGRVQVFPWVPQLEVLRCADAAVVHGGINTIDECVLAQVPMLVCCGGETDMAGNEARVLHHGLGLSADTQRISPQAIANQLARLIREEGFRHRLEALRADALAYGKRRVAEQVIDRLLAAGGPRP